MVGVEGGRMASFGGHHDQGGGKSPADRLCGPAEFPPAGMGFRAAHHPGHRDDVSDRGHLLDLFKGVISQIPGRAVTRMQVKQDGIALLDPSQTAGANWTASCVITGHLVIVLRREAEFWSGNHAFLMREVRDEIRRRHVETAETKMGKSRASAFTEDAQWIVQITRTGAWLSVLPSNVNRK